MDWFLHDNGLRHERIKQICIFQVQLWLSIYELLCTPKQSTKIETDWTIGLKWGNLHNTLLFVFVSSIVTKHVFLFLM